MPWRQVLVALICTGLTVQTTPCSWVEVLSSWSQGYKAVVKLQMEETVDHWDIDVEFSESVINFEAWKGHVNKISDTSYSVSNTCYNNMVYSCQCFELPYLVRHEPMWVGNTTFKFNGDVVPACDPPFCDDSSSSGEANTTSTTSPADNQATTETEINSNLNVVNNILNDLTSLGRIRYKRQSNDFTKDENELLDTLAEYTTYLKNECSTISGNCQSKTLATYGSKLNAIIQKIKKSGGISSGFLDAFKEKRDEVIEATETADRTQSEKKEKICMANGRPCVFPFKDDAGKEHNTCANYKGRYLWCATGVNSKGTYISWEKCPKGGRCDVPNDEKATTKKTTTTTTTTTTTKTKQGVSCMAGSKPCVFPFKNDDGTEHNECADYKGRYLWCATAVNSKGTYTTWGKCTECKDPKTSPSTPGDCSCTDYINKKGYGDCKKGHPDFNNAEICYVKLPSTCSDLRESKTDPGKMASAEACKKDDSCCQELDIASTGIALEHQGARLGSYKKQAEEYDGKPVYLQEGAGGNYLFYRETFGWLISRQGPQSTSEGGIMSDSEADCPTDGGMQWKIYDRVTYENKDSTFKLTCKGSDTTISNPPTKPPGSCLANGKPCIFPFKDDDGTSYNGCPKYEDRYYWCATSLKTNGVFKVWEHCPEDGSCPLLNNDESSTSAVLHKPTTKPNESPETTTSVKWETGTTTFHISDGNNNYKCEISFEFNANRKTEFKAISSTCSESKKQEDVMQYVGKHNFSLISKEGATLECFVAAAIARGDLCQTVLEDSLHCDSKSGSTCGLTRGIPKCREGYRRISKDHVNLDLLPESKEIITSSNDCKTSCDTHTSKECIAYFYETVEDPPQSCTLKAVCKLYKKSTNVNPPMDEETFCHKICIDQEKIKDDNSCMCGRNPPSACGAKSYCINEVCVPECKHGEIILDPSKCRCENPGVSCKKMSICISGLTCQEECTAGVQLDDPSNCHCGGLGKVCKKMDYCVGGTICSAKGCPTSTVNPDKEGCVCGTDKVLCPTYHMCTDKGCTCSQKKLALCNFKRSTFCVYQSGLNQVDPCDSTHFLSNKCSCSQTVGCPEQSYLDKHVPNNDWFSTYTDQARAYLKALWRNYNSVVNKKQSGYKKLTYIFHRKPNKNYKLDEHGKCEMTVAAPVYECKKLVHTMEMENEIKRLWNNKDTTNINKCSPPTATATVAKCIHDSIRTGHLVNCL